ncbi:histidine kinase [Kribbella sp. VKM Ac-2569]|uniref:sensor histidine kinase n=1 Tax=Kribbella sp. VKM Ac-2569 TaxID=2512220 RepID=UPI00102D082E|nr:histidine kinase [Kribbella sp. VKM Ac-2569]
MAPAIARARGPGPWALWATVVVGLGTLLVSIALAMAGDELVRPGLQAFLFNWITIPYLISGTLAWWRRPESRLGPLMIATAFVMALTALQWSSLPALHSLGNLLDMVPSAMFLHVFLAYPTGQLATRPRQVVVIAGYVNVVVLQLAKILLGSNPDSLLAITAQPALASRIEQFQLVAMSALLLIGTALLLVRRPSPGLARRRPVTLLVDTFGLALVMLALLYVAGLRGWPQIETVRHITFAALGLAPAAFLLGLLDARLARTDVGALLMELRAHPTSDLREPLARALHDPSLTLAYWLPQYGTWADPDGQAVTLRGADEGRATRVIHRDHEPIIALEFDRSLEDERELLDAVAAAAGIALENNRLQVELRARLQELQGSRSRVIDAEQKERQRLERNLHDGAQQRLVALALELGLLANSSTDSSETAARLLQAKREVAVSLDELRDVARGIHPAVLTGHGLAVALESLAAQAAVPVELDVAIDGRLPERVEVAAYYVVSESLTNIGKHAEATTASIRVTRSADAIVVAVIDNGIGGADTEGGTGLRGLADRVEAVGGQLRIWSPAGHGTRLEAEFPCE